MKKPKLNLPLTVPDVLERAGAQAEAFQGSIDNQKAALDRMVARFDTVRQTTFDNPRRHLEGTQSKEFCEGWEQAMRMIRDLLDD